MNFNKALRGLVGELGVEFMLAGNPVDFDEIFAETGLLPAIARRADQLCTLCLGYGIGATFVEEEDAVLGIKVQFDEVTPNVLRLLCIYDVMKEIVDASSTKEQVSLDELMYD